MVPASSYLKLNLGLSDILLAATAAGNLLGLSDLGADGLRRKLWSVCVAMLRRKITYIGAEVLKGETLDSVDAELGVGLDNGETAGHYTSNTIVS